MDYSPVIMGEVLFDCFGDDCNLGGAPFNVAWHLRGFDLKPRFISRVGVDADGLKVRERMLDWGLKMDWLEEDPEHPTGRVSIRVKNGQPAYTILPSQAYDYIVTPKALGDCSNSLFYHGSLVTRHEVSRATLSDLRTAFAGRVFVDVNLRKPWWTPAILYPLISNVSWLKLNEEELSQLSVNGQDASYLARKYNAEQVILTRGDRGADIYDEKQRLYHASPNAGVKLVDTVGAGDAFSAVVILGLIEGWEWPVILNRATNFAARVCSWHGALTNDRTIYQEILREWREGSTQ